MRGEVWWAETPDESPRPYLILTRTEAISALNKLVVAPATRTVRGIATEVKLGPEDGMPSECALSLDNTTLIRKSLLLDQITVLGPEKMAEVCRALRAATDC